MTDLLLLSRIPGISRGFSGRGGLSSAVFGAFFCFVDRYNPSLAQTQDAIDCQSLLFLACSYLLVV
jgi:hypothetical protein